MKKYLLYTFLGAASLMASCTEDFNEDVAAPQQWEQEAAVDAPNVTAQSVGSIDLGTAGDSVTVFSLNVTSIPTGTTIANLRLQSDEASVEIKADNNGKIASADLQALIEKQYGKRPTERTLYAVVHGDCMKDGQASFFNAGQIEIKATPKAPQISNEYYLIGEASEWNLECTSAPFSHSTKDIYEDPIFTIVFTPIDSDNDGFCWFAVTDSITIKANDWKQVFGCAEGNGSGAEEGIIKRRADLVDDGSFKVAVDGSAKFIKMTLNMMDYTYKIEKLNFSEFIYVPGNHQGWAPDKAPALQSPNFDGVYVGFSYLNGNFKFTKERNWDAEYNFNDFATKDEIFFNNDGSNINISEEGFYQITADVSASKLSAVKTTWGIIGPAQAGGWDSDTDMTWNAEDESWTATIDLVADEFKFRANDNWDINVGGSIDNLTQGGGNMKITEAGTYEVKLFLTRSTSNQMYCTLTKK